MSKKSKKKKKKKNEWADAPDRIPPAPPGFLCARGRGADIGSASEQSAHNLNVHLYGAANARE